MRKGGREGGGKEVDSRRREVRREEDIEKFDKKIVKSRRGVCKKYKRSLKNELDKVTKVGIGIE